MMMKASIRQRCFWLLGENRFQQQRCFSACRRNENPFSVLGIPYGSSYANVKRAFVKLALKYHPDRHPQNQRKEHTEVDFIRIRQAFEVIRQEQLQQNKGNAKVNANDDDDDNDHEFRHQWTDQEMDAWLREQTNLMFSFDMDAKTRQEVVRSVEQLSPGGLDSQNTWFMARMLAEQDKGRPTTNNRQGQPKRLAANTLTRRRRRSDH